MDTDLYATRLFDFHFYNEVNSCTNIDDLMDFAATMGIQDSPIVRYRRYQLENDNNYQIDNDMTPADSPVDPIHVRREQEIEGLVRSYLLMDDIDQAMEDYIQDDDFIVQPPSPQPGPSNIVADENVSDNENDLTDDENVNDRDTNSTPTTNYQIRKVGQRQFKKNQAVENTFEVKIDERYYGQSFDSIQDSLYRMFENILSEARGGAADNDLGRVIIYHDNLDSAIVIPLQRWDELTVEKILERIMNVLNSHEELTIDQSFIIVVGSIRLPKGGARRRITSIKGNKNSLDLKKSVVTIENVDNLCMARSIAVSWASLHKCTSEEWKNVRKNGHGKSNIELILEHKLVPENFYRNVRNKKRNEQKKLAEALCRHAKVTTEQPLGLADIAAFEEYLGVRVMVVSACLGNKFITSPSTDARSCIYIYLVDDNHFHAITSITGFFCKSYFCEKCLKHYCGRERHSCEIKCLVCKRDLCVEVEPVECTDCNMTCRSAECYFKHKTPPLNVKKSQQTRGLSECEKWWKCSNCCKVLKLSKRKKEEHQCGEYQCSSCSQYVFSDHKCYLRAKQSKKDHNSKFIFYDFECSQDEKSECEKGYLKANECKQCKSPDTCSSCIKCINCRTSWCGKMRHRPNFVVAHSVCPLCIDEEMTPESICKGCGTRCDQCDNSESDFEADPGPCPGTCGFREVIFEGEETVEKFGRWLFSDQHKYFKVIAHNMKSYDGYFILDYLVDHSVRPNTIIYNGSKIMYMAVEKDLHIKMVDSLNFLPMKLSALPKTFGLKELKKGWFPHYFNTRENQNYKGSYPDPEFYGAQFMGEDDRNELLQWLEKKKNMEKKEDRTFIFREEMLEYCRSDVTILREACLKFRHILMSLTGEKRPVKNKKGKIEEKWFGSVDPFDSITIASVCMDVFKTKFLEETWRVKLPGSDHWVPAKLFQEKMYVQDGNEWIDIADIEEEHGEFVCEKEFVSTPIAKIPPSGYSDQYSKQSIEWLEWVAKVNKVDIQHAQNLGEKTIPNTRYKLDGYCSETNTAYEFHGCVFHGCVTCFPDNRKETKHPLTQQTMDELYTLTQKKKEYIENLGMNYISIWEHTFRKQKEENPELKKFLSDLDITERLNPRDSFFGGRTNASQLYHRVQEKDEKVHYFDFTSLYPYINKYSRYPVGHPKIITKDFGDINEYFGIAKVKILPPRGLFHPVLPTRSNGKLKFSLCRTCADNESTKKCKCNESQRELTGTWCTPELITAVRLGYTIRKIYEIYHWEESSQYDPTTREGGLFAKYVDAFLKIKQEASGRPEWVDTEEDMEKYCSQYLENEGISLDPGSIVENKGLRALAKLVLNSFWGKFGQRLNLKQTTFFHESEVNQFFQMLSDPMKRPIDFHILSDDIIQLEWAYKKDCELSDNKTNIYLATFTTCWARLKLYSLLEQLQKRILYYDTDSIIFVSQPDQYNPPLGDYLGELTDELKGKEHIVEFVSGGPKNYAYKTNLGNETCKVRGFTLNYTNSQLINFTTVKKIVTGPQQSINVVMDKTTNIYVATFTTKWSKRQLEKVFERMDRKMLYTDRNCVMYISHPDQSNPWIQDYLSVLTKVKKINEYYVNKIIDESCMVTGFTIEYTKSMITGCNKKDSITVTNPSKICRDKRKRKIFNQEEKKKYQMVYTKRRKLKNYGTEPYGF